ncbi:alpha-amylase [Tricharina praecox]|uniref:alpha-amylase n=1 Tax=Tricharina praecox TaxID=43433 RepID=UPI002220A2A3|nr:alpha-amylase [Tricharina praecox]KAI5850741.1 alpha-amylase [Tricharina praecox]
MHFHLPLLLCALLSIPLCEAATPEQWRTRSIYQVLTDRFAVANGSSTRPCDTGARQYCGGSYRGIVEQLDYIQGMGFTAIWISPVVKNIDGRTGWGEAFHGYWAQDIAQLNPHFGTAAELAELSDALHARGMYLMVDVVPNHFAHAGDVEAVAYEGFGAPFNKKSAFHKHCWITDYDDQEMVENCWLGDKKVALVDVDTTLPWVQETMNSWVKELVETYRIDGLRIDTAKHMGQQFLYSFNAAAAVFSMGEVYHEDPGYTCQYQNAVDGLLNYPIWYSLTSVFQSTRGDILRLTMMINVMRDYCLDTNLFGTFSENHDQARFPSLTSDQSLITNALTFTLIHDGIPIIYAGQEHQFSGKNDPYNREALWHTGFSRDSPHYRLISKLNAFRAAQPYSYFTDKARVIHIAPPHTFALRKGPAVSILTNLGARSGRKWITLPKGRTGWMPGSWAADILNCYITRVKFNGYVDVRIDNGRPRVLYPLLDLHEMGFCRDIAVPAIGWLEILVNWIGGWSWWGLGAAAVGWKRKEL